MCALCNMSRVIHALNNFSIRTTSCPACSPETAEEREKRFAAIVAKLDGLDNGED